MGTTNKTIEMEYDTLTRGFVDNPLFHSNSTMPNGKFVQLSAYKEKRSGIVNASNIKDLKLK